MSKCITPKRLPVVHAQQDPRRGVEWSCDGYVPWGPCSVPVSRLVFLGIAAGQSHVDSSIEFLLIQKTAYLGHFDFIYTLPDVYLSVPFPFLGKS